MSHAEQLPLDLPRRVALGGEDFFVSPSNETAVGWIDRWPDWPGRVLALYGPEGAGKSHLVGVWREKSGGAALSAAELTESAVAAFPAAGNLALEDVDAYLTPESQALFFHLINLVRERQGTLLLTARRAPALWGVTLPDLASRLKAMPAVGIADPDESLIAAILMKEFADRQLKVSADVLSYLVSRLDRSFAAAHGAVEALDRASLAHQRAITVPLARTVLQV